MSGNPFRTLLNALFAPMGKGVGAATRRGLVLALLFLTAGGMVGRAAICRWFTRISCKIRAMIAICAPWKYPRIGG